MVPAHQLVGKNECATAAEEAARVAFARGVFREGLTPKVSGAPAPVNQGVRPSRNTPLAKGTRAASSAAVAHSFLPPSWCAAGPAAQVEGALD